MVARSRLLLIDDHPVVLAGLRLLMTESARYTIVGEARTAEAGRAAADRREPDVIVTDLVMGGDDRIALIEDLLAIAPAAAVVVYSSSDPARWAGRALRAGARGYVSKAEPLEAVVVAMDAVLAGAIHVTPLLEEPGPGEAMRGSGVRNSLVTLSTREHEVLALMGGGLGPRALSDRLGLSVKTIGTYRERLKIKLGLDTMRLLERFAVEHLASIDELR